MTALPAAAGRVNAFLSPGRTPGASIGRAIRAGLALAALATALASVLLLGASVLAPGMEPMAKTPDLQGWRGAFIAIVAAPVLETAMLALAYAAVSAVTGSAVLAPVLVIAPAAGWLHPHNGAFMLVPATSFAAMAWQYARHKQELGAVGACGCVALTHATLNGVFTITDWLGL